MNKERIQIPKYAEKDNSIDSKIGSGYIVNLQGTPPIENTKKIYNEVIDDTDTTFSPKK